MTKTLNQSETHSWNKASSLSLLSLSVNILLFKHNHNNQLGSGPFLGLGSQHNFMDHRVLSHLKQGISLF